LQQPDPLSSGHPASWGVAEQWVDRHLQCRHRQGRHEGRPTCRTCRRWCL